MRVSEKQQVGQQAAGLRDLIDRLLTDNLSTEQVNLGLRITDAQSGPEAIL